MKAAKKSLPLCSRKDRRSVSDDNVILAWRQSLVQGID
jgi:hypothetical protein